VSNHRLTKNALQKETIPEIIWNILLGTKDIKEEEKSSLKCEVGVTMSVSYQLRPTKNVSHQARGHEARTSAGNQEPGFIARLGLTMKVMAQNMRPVELVARTTWFWNAETPSPCSLCLLRILTSTLFIRCWHKHRRKRKSTAFILVLNPAEHLFTIWPPVCTIVTIPRALLY
jgi:hypothetical protein